jgi:ferritin-like protein
MWRTALAISIAATIALLSVVISAQTANQCGVVYYTVTKTYTKVQTVTSVDEVVTYSTVTTTAVDGNATTTVTSVTPITTTTTRTLTTTSIDVEPGGILANFTCTWAPPPTLTQPPVSAPGLPTPRSDFVYLLLASVAFGVFALALVYDLTKIVMFLIVATAAIWIMASAYTPLAPLAAGLTALTVAFVLATAFFKR